MVVNNYRFFILVLLGMCLSQIGWSNSIAYREQVYVAMRMIGHELLLASGDSISRVLPITKEDDRYKIQFAADFSFEPGQLTSIVDSIVQEIHIASRYVVEVQDCDSGQVVYSYGIIHDNKGDFLPCMGRSQPLGCYVVFMRIIAPANPPDEQNLHASLDHGALIATKDQPSNSTDILYYVAIGMVISLLIVISIKKRSFKKGAHLITIGSYLFDQKNMSLLKGDQKQDLTGKETDLLQLLFIHLNATVDRDVILKEVWRDDGVYNGRTLDVYISKLRKKFESDPAISIINVRGVGYKMTLD